MIYIQTPISRELGDDLSSLLDEFQEVVNTGNTTSYEGGMYSHSDPYYSNRDPKYQYVWELRRRLHERETRSPSFSNTNDTPIPLDTYGSGRKECMFEGWSSYKNYSPLENTLMRSGISDQDKELVWEFLVRGGDMYSWKYGEMDYWKWWRMTKGILWKLYNFLQSFKIPNRKLGNTLTDLIFDLTSVKGSRSQQGEDFEYKTLQELYDPDKEVQELKEKIRIEERKISSRIFHDLT